MALLGLPDKHAAVPTAAHWGAVSELRTVDYKNNKEEKWLVLLSSSVVLK